MLTVPTTVKPSPIHGLGLFAVEQIPAGTIVWRFHDLVDQSFSRTRLEGFGEPLRSTLLRYSYVDPAAPKIFVICGDDARFWNFADPANCGEKPGRNRHAPLIARRDIAAGEELTVGTETDADAARKLALQKP